MLLSAAVCMIFDADRCISIYSMPGITLQHVLLTAPMTANETISATDLVHGIKYQQPSHTEGLT